MGMFDFVYVLVENGVCFWFGLLVCVYFGVLYVDEVNLFVDGFVDMLFDVVVSGVNIVECDGVLYVYDVCFVLVGMMNFEEGELCL